MALRSFFRQHENALFVLACAIFLALILAASQGVFESDEPAPPANAEATLTAPAETIPEEPAPAGTPALTQQPALRLVSSELTPASTPSGQSRNRSRLSVFLRLENTGDAELFGSSSAPPELVLADGSTVAPDRAALQQSAAAFGVDEPLAPGESRTGELRFELAGEQTTQVTEQESTLRLATGEAAGPLSVAVPAAGS